MQREEKAGGPGFGGGVGGRSKEGCEDQRGRQEPDKSQTKQETPTPKPD